MNSQKKANNSTARTSGLEHPLGPNGEWRFVPGGRRRSFGVGHMHKRAKTPLSLGTATAEHVVAAYFLGTLELKMSRWSFHSPFSRRQSSMYLP